LVDVVEKMHKLAEELSKSEAEKLMYARKLKIMKDEYRKVPLPFVVFFL